MSEIKGQKTSKKKKNKSSRTAWVDKDKLTQKRRKRRKRYRLSRKRKNLIVKLTKIRLRLVQGQDIHHQDQNSKLVKLKLNKWRNIKMIIDIERQWEIWMNAIWNKYGVSYKDN